MCADDDEIGPLEEYQLVRRPEMELSLPAPPEGAASEVMNRIVQMNEAFASGHCDECLVDMTLTWKPRDDGGPDDMVAAMDHLAGCPLSSDAVNALAAVHGLDSVI